MGTRQHLHVNHDTGKDVLEERASSKWLHDDIWKDSDYNGVSSAAYPVAIHRELCAEIIVDHGGWVDGCVHRNAEPGRE